MHLCGIIKLFLRSFNDKISNVYKKIAPSNPNLLDVEQFEGIWNSQGRKKTRDHQFNMENKNEKTMRMKELESGQQEVQEKIAQMTKMVTNLTKGKRITNDLGLQRKPTSRKSGTNPSIKPNTDDPCEQERLRKDPFGRLNMSRCNKGAVSWTRS